MNDKELIQKFITLAIETFSFLESDYGYKVIMADIENQDYYPDAQVAIKYASTKIEIEVFWYFASAVIGVAFTELVNEERSSYVLNGSKTINLYALASFINNGKDDMFLLRDITNVKMLSIKKREKIIKEKMKEILENMASGVKTYAINIINGDTSSFQEVQKHQTMLIEKHYS